MSYFNLVEDEKEARYERQGINLAIGLILLSGLFVWLSRKKSNH